MKAFNKKIGRVIDFEGSLKTGIQQAAIIDFSDFCIFDSKEYLNIDGNFKDWIIKNTNQNQIEIFVAHNIQIEKNIINKYIPYKSSINENHTTLKWGPWVDTLLIYKALYPNINSYKLNNLGRLFLNQVKIKTLAKKLCKRTKVRSHQSMYDAVLTFLLLERLKNKIDISLFSI